MKRLIVNADDLGYDPSVTTGIIRCLQFGLVRSATLMVNTPYAADAAQAARPFAIGLHLNLARWAPLSANFPAALLERGELVEARVSELSSEVVEAEADAQIARARSLLGKSPTHIDVHKHLHRHEAVFDGVIRAAQRAGLPVRALENDMRERVRSRGVSTTDGFIGDAGSEAYWTLQRWRDALATLPEGVTELMCHPGHTPSHVRSGYGAQREVELATFTSPEAQRALAQSDVALVTFEAL